MAGAFPRNPAKPLEEVLPEKSLAVSPSAPNMLKPALFRDAVAKVAGAGRSKGAGAALVIPDYAARMAVLDFEDFPQGEAERIALLRFRLRKSVPFHIDEAQLAYAVQFEEPQHVEVLAVAIAHPILNEYETLFTDAGYRLGLVTPSTLAALPLYSRSEGGLTLVAKAAGNTLSVLLLEQNRVRLVRCIDLSGSEVGDSDEATAVWDEGNILSLLQQTIAYAEDQIGEPARRLLLCGFGTETDPVGALMHREFGLQYEAVRSKFGLASQQNAGVLGLLEQYAA